MPIAYFLLYEANTTFYYLSNFISCQILSPVKLQIEWFNKDVSSASYDWLNNNLVGKVWCQT